MRKSLRKIPNIAPLSSRDLDAVLAKMYCRDYKSGDTLWHTRKQLDFLGIIQCGEIVLEHQFCGKIIRSVKLQAGDYINQTNFEKNTKNRTSILAKAVTDVRLCVLSNEQLVKLGLRNAPSRAKKSTVLQFFQGLPWQSLMIAAIVLFTVFIGRQDIKRIFSGSVYLLSLQSTQTSYDYPSSLRLFQYAKFIDQTAAFLHAEEGNIWLSQGNLPRAETSFLNAVNAHQNDALAMNNLAVLYSTAGELQQALSYQQRASSTAPNRAIVHYNLGLLLMQKNELQQALRELKEANYIDPTWSQPHIQRAYIYLIRQDYHAAEQEALIAIRLDTTQYFPYLFHAIALYNQRKYQEALDPIENASMICPDCDISRFYKALIFTKLGKSDMAYSILRKLLEKTADPEQVLRITAEINSVQRSLQNHPFGAYKWRGEK